MTTPSLKSMWTWSPALFLLLEPAPALYEAAQAGLLADEDPVASLLHPTPRHPQTTDPSSRTAQMSPDQTADSQNSEVGKWLLFKAPSSKWVLYLGSQAGKSVTGTRWRTAEGHEDGQPSSPKGNRLCSSFQQLPLTIVHRTVVDSFKEKTNIKIFSKIPQYLNVDNVIIFHTL